MATPAASAIDGMAWHCYGGEQVMSQFHVAYPDEPEIMSECSPGIIPYTAIEAAISGLRNWASGIDLWNLALNPAGGPVEPPDSGCGGCTGLVTVAPNTHTVSYNRNFYELGQLSKFVQRGAVRISTPRWVNDFSFTTGYGVTHGLDNVAFLNPDGTYALSPTTTPAPRLPSPSPTTDSSSPTPCRPPQPSPSPGTEQGSASDRRGCSGQQPDPRHIGPIPASETARRWTSGHERL